MNFFSFSFKRFYLFVCLLVCLFIYLEGKGGGNTRGKTSMCDCLLWLPTGDLAYNPGMCSDWESNLQPLASQADTQSTEPGLYTYYFYFSIFIIITFYISNFETCLYVFFFLIFSSNILMIYWYFICLKILLLSLCHFFQFFFHKPLLIFNFSYILVEFFHYHILDFLQFLLH